MPRTYIPISLAGEGEGPHLLNTAIASLRQARRDIEKVRERMLYLQDGSVWTDLEAHFGLPAGGGDDVFTLVDGTLQVLDGTSSGYALELTSRVGIA